MSTKKPPHKMSVVEFNVWWEKHCHDVIIRQLTHLVARYGRHRVVAALDAMQDRHHVLSETAP